MSTDDIRLFLSTSGSPNESEHSGTINRNLFVNLTKSREDERPKEITFNLFGNVNYTLRTDKIETADDGGLLWHGHFVEIPEIQGAISVSWLDSREEFLVSGYLHVFKDDYYFQSTTITDAIITKGKKLPWKCDHSMVIDNAHIDDFYENKHPSESSVIDVVAVYPKSLLENVKNRDIKIKNVVNTAKAYVDGSFSNSGINATIRIVGVEECVDLKKSAVKELLCMVADSEKNPDTLQKGAAYDAVSKIREKYKADIVALIAPNASPGNVVGKASAIPVPPSQQNSDLLNSTFAAHYDSEYPNEFLITFAHELGHLLGGRHDRFTEPAIFGAPEFDYARGYISEDHSFVTLMGYPNKYHGRVYENIPIYSVSDKKWNGEKMGVAADHKSPADCAHLFRWSTQVVANYRGTTYPNDYCHLNIEIKPNGLGGTATPSLAGPYKPGTEVSLTALPRAGHAFSHWKINEKDERKVKTISLKMDKSIKISANFVSLKDQEPKLTVDESINKLKDHFDITIKPHEGKNEAGVTVSVTVAPKSNDLPSFEYFGWFWSINGKRTHRHFVDGLSFIMEDDVVLSASPNSTIEKTGYYADFGINAYSEYGVRVLDGLRRASSKKKVCYSLIGAPDSVKIVGDGIVTTDDHGLAKIKIYGGKAGTRPSKFIIRVEVLDEPGSEQYYSASLHEYIFEIKENGNLNRVIRSGDKLHPVTIRLLKNGVPEKNVTIPLGVVRIDGESGSGVSLLDKSIKTNDKGEAIIHFSSVHDDHGNSYVIFPASESFGRINILGIDVFPSNCRFSMRAFRSAYIQRGSIRQGDEPFIMVSFDPPIHPVFDVARSWGDVMVETDSLDIMPDEMEMIFSYSQDFENEKLLRNVIFLNITRKIFHETKFFLENKYCIDGEISIKPEQ